MISEYTRLDVGKMSVEVNWNAHVTPCKKFKFIWKGDGPPIEQVVDRNEVYAMLFMFGDDNQQVDLIPVKTEKIRAINTMMGIRAKKDIRKGETIKFRHTYFMPEREYESLILDPSRYKAADVSTSSLDSIVDIKKKEVKK
jgi:hypothetical protein